MMMLTNEILIKEPIRKKLAAEAEEWLASGHIIQEIEIGITGAPVTTVHQSKEHKAKFNPNFTLEAKR